MPFVKGISWSQEISISKQCINVNGLSNPAWQQYIINQFRWVSAKNKSVCTFRNFAFRAAFNIGETSISRTVARKNNIRSEWKMEISDKELFKLWNHKYFMRLIAIQSQGKRWYGLRNLRVKHSQSASWTDKIASHFLRISFTELEKKTVTTKS